MDQDPGIFQSWTDALVFLAAVLGFLVIVIGVVLAVISPNGFPGVIMVTVGLLVFGACAEKIVRK